jgi:hypothetical protein
MPSPPTSTESTCSYIYFLFVTNGLNKGIERSQKKKRGCVPIHDCPEGEATSGGQPTAQTEKSLVTAKHIRTRGIIRTTQHLESKGRTKAKLTTDTDNIVEKARFSGGVY